MASEPQRHTGFAVVDPNEEPVRVIDQATFHGMRGSLLDVTLCTVITKEDNQRTPYNTAVVAARLRFDLAMAKALRDGLIRQIELAEVSPRSVN